VILIVLGLVFYGAKKLGFNDTKDNPNYPMQSSYAYVDIESNIGWLSNDEIIFSGTENTSKEISSGVYLSTISMWKVKEGIPGVRIYKRNVKRLCYEGNSIAYTIKRNLADPETHFYGTLRQENPADFKEINWRSCQSSALLGDGTRHIRLLLPEHGYLDRGSIQDDSKNIPIIFYKKDATQGMTLPLMSREDWDVKYSPFKNAYLVTRHYLNPVTNIEQSPWPSDIPRPLWWLTPEGNTTKFFIQPPWNDSFDFFATKAGIVVDGSDKRLKKPKFSDEGLYLLKENGSAETLLKGHVRNVTVSPDGCAIAFAHIEIPLNRSSAILKVMQLCTKGN
jgi:hypothetical protein